MNRNRMPARRQGVRALGALAASFLIANTAVSQVPVTVTSDIPAMINQNATMAKWVEQLTAMRNQYEQLRQQYEAITGHYERGILGLAESVHAVSVVPGSWQEVVALQKSGAFKAIQNNIDELTKPLPPELFRDPNGQGATNYKLSSDAVRAAMAGGQALYAQVQTNLTNLLEMTNKIDSTLNSKDASDLQNRIATENGLLQSAIAKLTMMNLNLQANVLNLQNQATAINQQRYGSPTP